MRINLYHLLALAWLTLPLAAQVNDALPVRPALGEIGLASGKVIPCQITRRDTEKILCRVADSNEEQSLPLSEVIFIRSPEGSYEFIFPEEKPVESVPAGSTLKAPTEDKKTILLLGIGLQYSDNSALTGLANNYAQALAADYNARLSPADFVAQPGLGAAKLAAFFSVEYRWLQDFYALGLAAGYMEIPKSSAVVSSASRIGEETIIVDGYAVPVAALIYYRIWSNSGFALNLGAGGGALFASVLVTRNFGGKSDYEEVRGLAPLLLLRPELSLRTGSVTLIAALPVFWAEGRPVGGDIAGLGTVGQIAAASLTGAGLTLAVGYSF